MPSAPEASAAVVELQFAAHLELHALVGVEELLAQGEKPDGDRIRMLREQFGLDRTPLEQYLHWAGGLLVGDLGWSSNSSTMVER